MGYTEFFCRSGGSQVNGGGLATGAEPPTTAAYTCTNSNWDGTSVFTPTDGSTPASTVSVGDFASVYLDGASVAVYVARVTNVAAGVNGAITLSTTAKMGTAPTSGGTGRSIKVGGAWKGPNAADGFPLTILASTLTNSAGDVPRVNLKNDATYSCTGATTTTVNGPWVVQGYSASAGDGGKATWDGGTSVAGYVLFTNASSQTKVVDVNFQNNGNSGNTNLVTASGAGQTWLRCAYANARANGLAITGAIVHVEAGEAYGCNQSNTASQGGFNATNTCFLKRCISHDNTTANAMGFITTGSMFLEDCIADSNGSRGYNCGSTFVSMINCDAYNNGSDGVALTTSSASTFNIENCNFIKNAGWGINGSGSGARLGHVRNCGFGSGTQLNTSGTTTGLKGVVESGTITYASGVTPWVDPANGDFRINLATAKGAGYGVFTQTAASYAGTVSYPDIGAAQHLETTDYPAATDVRSGVSYNFSASTGNMTEPDAGDVRTGIQYGANGTEFTGTYSAGTTPPNAPTLAIDTDGTLATITGGSSDATHTVYAGSFTTFASGSITFASAGSRTGNGTVALTLDPGWYVGYVLATRDDDTVPSNVVFFCVTDDTTAIHYRCLLSIQAKLQLMAGHGALPGITADNVKVRWLPRLKEQAGNIPADETPCIIVAPPLPESMMGGMNNSDDIGFNCIVAFFDAEPDLTNNLARNLLWRELAIRALDQQRLDGVEEVEKVDVLPEAVVDLAAWKEQYWVSAFNARCVARVVLAE